MEKSSGCLFAFFEGATARRSRSSSSATLEGENDGKRDLAVLEIVADILAEIGFSRVVVEDVVDQLEDDAEIFTVGSLSYTRPRRPWPIGDDGAEFGGGGEERRGLCRDHLHIGGLGGFGVVRGDELGDLAFRDDGGGVG